MQSDCDDARQLTYTKEGIELKAGTRVCQDAGAGVVGSADGAYLYAVETNMPI